MTYTRIDVSLAKGAYPVFCGSGLLARGDIWKPFVGTGQVAVISNNRVLSLHGDGMTQQVKAKTVILPDGEEHKNFKTLEIALDELAAMEMRRDGTVIALGGGVIGDTAGFAAASYMRGVRLLHMPTTLLAQVDAAIGGKTGVNRPHGKNMVGAFYQPVAVVCDTSTLATLPSREYVAGLAEIVKYALLGDAPFFVWLEDNVVALLAQEPTAVRHVVETSVRAKAVIVAADEHEIGDLRVLLNLGHTFAHGIENVAGYGAWLHGEAVAVGMVAAARLSEKMCGFVAADTARIIALLRRLQLPYAFPNIDTDTLLCAMRADKKHAANKLHFVVMEAVGRARTIEIDDETPVRQTIEEMR